VAQVRGMTNDGLVRHKQVGGVEGSTLVADLATSLPRPTDGGTPPTPSSYDRGSATRPGRG
jgi:hypothetical protein